MEKEKILSAIREVFDNMGSFNFAECFYEDGVQDFLQRLEATLFPQPIKQLFNGHIEKYIVIAENIKGIPKGTMCYQSTGNMQMGKIVEIEGYPSLPLLPNEDVVSCLKKHGIEVENLSEVIKKETAESKGKLIENPYIPFRKQEQSKYPLIIQRDEFGTITRCDHGLQGEL